MSSSGRETGTPRASKAGESVCVVCHIRPLLPRELTEGCKSVLIVPPGADQVTVDGLLVHQNSFGFDAVYGSRDVVDSALHPDELYATHVEPMVEGLFAGFNAAVMAYGQTGTGKSYTMGTDFEGISKQYQQTRPCDPGTWIPISQRAIEDIAGRAARLREGGSQVDMRCSFFEIYQDRIHDLLAATSPTRCGSTPQQLTHSRSKSRIPLYPHREIVIRDPDPKREVMLVGLEEVQVLDAAQLHQCVTDGVRARVTASTHSNAHSSRSHALLVIHITQQQPAAVGDTTLSSKLYLVDLAGSERLGRSGAEGTRLTEACSINTGLLALGNVIEALSDARRMHVPYRDHVLTRVLRHALGGNSRTLMVACVSPADIDVAETLNTLRYAARARLIHNTPEVNAKRQQCTAAEVAALRAENEALREQLADMAARLSSAEQAAAAWEQAATAAATAVQLGVTSNTDAEASDPDAETSTMISPLPYPGTPNIDDGKVAASGSPVQTGGGGAAVSRTTTTPGPQTPATLWMEQVTGRVRESALARAAAESEYRTVRSRLDVAEEELSAARGDVAAEHERAVAAESRVAGLAVKLHEALQVNAQLLSQLEEVKRLAAEQLAATAAAVAADDERLSRENPLDVLVAAEACYNPTLLGSLLTRLSQQQEDGRELQQLHLHRQQQQARAEGHVDSSEEVEAQRQVLASHGVVLGVEAAEEGRVSPHAPALADQVQGGHGWKAETAAAGAASAPTAAAAAAREASSRLSGQAGGPSRPKGSLGGLAESLLVSPVAIATARMLSAQLQEGQADDEHQGSLSSRIKRSRTQAGPAAGTSSGPFGRSLSSMLLESASTLKDRPRHAASGTLDGSHQPLHRIRTPMTRVAEDAVSAGSTPQHGQAGGASGGAAQLDVLWERHRALVAGPEERGLGGLIAALEASGPLHDRAMAIMQRHRARVLSRKLSAADEARGRLNELGPDSALSWSRDQAAGGPQEPGGGERDTQPASGEVMLRRLMQSERAGDGGAAELDSSKFQKVLELWCRAMTQECELSVMIEAERASRHSLQEHLKQLNAAAAPGAEGPSEQRTQQGEEGQTPAAPASAPARSSTSAGEDTGPVAEPAGGAGAAAARRHELEARMAQHSSRMMQLLVLKERCRSRADWVAVAAGTAEQCGEEQAAQQQERAVLLPLLATVIDYRRLQQDLAARSSDLADELALKDELVELYCSEAADVSTRLHTLQQHNADVEADNTRLGVLAAQRAEAITMMVAAKIAQADAEERMRALEDDVAELRAQQRHWHLERQQQQQQRRSSSLQRRPWHLQHLQEQQEQQQNPHAQPAPRSQLQIATGGDEDEDFFHGLRVASATAAAHQGHSSHPGPHPNPMLSGHSSPAGPSRRSLEEVRSPHQEGGPGGDKNTQGWKAKIRRFSLPFYGSGKSSGAGTPT